MKPIEQLQEILCTVESVEKDVKELRLGCNVFIQNCIVSVTIIWDNRGLTLIEWAEYENFLWQLWTSTQSFQEKHITKIIWNPLSLKHLMMYCDEKGIENIWFYKKEILLLLEWKSVWICYEITKELYEQEDKVLLDIINFLKG